MRSLARFTRIVVVGTLLTAVTPTLVACGAAPASGPARVEGEAADLQFALTIKAGEGKVIEPSERAIRDALVNAGFRVGEAEDADVIFSLALSDVDAPQVFVVTVNGKVQTKRKVTAVLRAVTVGGDVLSRKTHSFVVSEDAPEIEEGDLAPLVQHFTASKELEKYGIERSIERAQRKLAPKATAEEVTEPAEPPPPPPAENTSTVREQ